MADNNAALPEGFEEVAQSSGTGLPEGFELVESPAQMALPDSQIQRTLIDVGRGMTNTIQGVEQLNKLKNLSGLKGKAEGKPFLDKTTGLVRKPTADEQRKFQDDFRLEQSSYDNWVADKSDELAMYQQGTEGRKWSALAGEMVGAAASLPVGGLPSKGGMAGWQLAKELGKRLSAEAGIGAGTAGLDFVPEGMSRKDNMIFGAFIGSALRGGIDSISGVSSTLKNVLAGKPMSLEEAQRVVQNIEITDPSLSESMEVLAEKVDQKFIDKYLADVPESEKAGMTKAMQERLAVFNFMNTEPTYGQILRDPMAMADEIKLSTTPLGESVRQRFTEQLDASGKKLREITGKNPSNTFGKDVIETFDEVKESWLNDNNTLYKNATDSVDPSVRFNLSATTSKISDLQEKIDIAPNAIAALKEINRKVSNALSMPEQVAAIDKQMKADFGDNAAGQAFKLMELQKLNDGINAKETEDLIVKTLNSYKNLSPEEKAIFSDLKESVLLDTIEGTGSDAFVAARKNFAEMQELIRQFPVMERLGFYKSGKAPMKAWSDDEVFKNIINANNTDFNNFMDLLESPRYAEKFSPLKESLRQSTFAHIADKAMTGNLDAQNNKTFVKNGYDKALNDLTKKGGMERLKKIFTEEEIISLGIIKRFGDMLQELPTRKTAVQPSGTAVQSFMGALGVFSNSPAGKIFASRLMDAGDIMNKMLGKDKVEVQRILNGPTTAPLRLQEAQNVIQQSNTPESQLSAIYEGLATTSGFRNPSKPVVSGVQSERKETNEERRKRQRMEALR